MIQKKIKFTYSYFTYTAFIDQGIIDQPQKSEVSGRQREQNKSSNQKKN